MIIPALKLSGVGQLPPEGRLDESVHATAIRGIPRVYHADGAFLARDGQRFDLLFIDLQKDATLPGYCFPGIGDIERALEVRFIRRSGRHRCSAWNWDSYP
jgi:hypothetical protein